MLKGTDTLVDIVLASDPVGAVVIDQRSAAAVLKPHLLAAEVEPVLTNSMELALACGGLLDDAL